jgi:transporter family protein
MKTWVLYAIISMFFAGITSVVAKLGMKNISGDASLAIRTSMIFILVWLNAFAFNHVKLLGKLTKIDFAFLCLSGLTTMLSWVFYYRAMKLGEVSVVASIDKASIVITILLSLFFLKEPLTPKLILGASLIVMGMLVLVWK